MDDNQYLRHESDAPPKAQLNQYLGSLHNNLTETESMEGKKNLVEVNLPPVNEDLAEPFPLEYLDQNPYNLSYTCLLIPRFNSYYLIGDVVDKLPVQLRQICAISGWALEFLNIKAEYLQWTVRVPPAIAPGHFMRDIREQTSNYILENHFGMIKENRPQDFWAPGYLVILGSQPHPIEMIQRFIRLTRQQQGIKLDE
jgi:REP element-mobilizing transposase RayT